MFTKSVTHIMFWIIVVGSELNTAECGCCGDQEPDQTLNPILSEGSLSFALNLYQELKDEKNVFFSPFSVRVALAMTAAGAGGTTFTQMTNVLHLENFTNEDECNLAFKSLLSSFCPNDKFTLSIANRMYVDEGSPVQDSFKATLEDMFCSGVSSVNFKSEAQETADSINHWVEQETNAAIKNLIAPLSTDTSVVLVNAIYFKGKWQSKFDPVNTKPRTFHLADGGSAQVPTMFSDGHFKMAFHQHLNAKVLQLSYDGPRLAMFIVLPTSNSDLSKLQIDLNSKNMNVFFTKGLYSQQVEVYLPKFKASYGEDLDAPLSSMGMSEVFGESADLSRMMSSGGVKVSRVVHRAVVDVDEEGTMAAAGTAVLVMAKSTNFVPKPVEFRVDRPCVYFIYDLKFKQILFMGNLDDPSTS